MEGLTISKLAKAAKVGIETVRFYERRGLLKKPHSKIGSYRQYPQTDITKIQFIKKAQLIGFTLGEIKELLILDGNKNSTCGDVKSRAQSKLDEVNEKIKSLKFMKESLEQLVFACNVSAEAKSCCKVITCFEGNC